MRCVAFSLAVLVAAFSEPLLVRSQEGADKRFDPARHIPAPALLHLSVGSVSRLGERLAETLVGRIATHPGTLRAFAGLAAMARSHLDQQSEGFRQVTGKTPLEVLGLIQGEVTIVIRGVSPRGGPEAVLAIELGKSRAEILGILQRLQSAMEEGGGKLPTQSLEGVQATLWPTPLGPAAHAVLGTHLIIATTPDFLRAIAAAFQGGKEPPAEAPKLLGADLDKRLTVRDREVLVVVDVAGARALLSAFVGSRGEEAAGKLEAVLRLTGLDRVTSLGYALGFRDGGMEGVCHLAMPEGAGGLLEALRNGLRPVGDLEDVLAMVPAAAHDVQASRFALGKLLSDADRVVREAFPESGDALDEIYAQVEENARISVKDDLFALGELMLCTFSVDPPAGGLFADQIALARTEALAGYWNLAGKVASIVGARATVLEYPGGKVEYFNFGSGLGKGGGLQQLIEGGWEPTLPEGLAILLTRAGGILARADLPGGWTAVSSAPQALVRHLEVYGKGPKLPADGAIARLAGAQARGACVLGVARSGKGLLGIYNTLLPIADALSPFLALAGVDPGQLPPAELFDEETRYAWLRLTLARDGFTFRGHRVLESSTGALVAASAAGIVAGFLVPTLLKGRSAAFDVQCGNNLKQLYVLAMQYSDKTPGRSFPHSPDGSLASLQLLIDGNEDAITSRLFLCPEGEESEAEDDDGKFELTEDTCSYEIVPWKLKNTTPDAILIYDKAPHHEGRRSVLFTDSRVELMEEEVFQARLEREQQKFAKTE